MPDTTFEKWDTAFREAMKALGLQRMTATYIQHGIHQHAAEKLGAMQERILRTQDDKRITAFLEEETDLLTNSAIRIQERQVLKAEFNDIRQRLQQGGITLPPNEAHIQLDRELDSRTRG